MKNNDIVNKYQQGQEQGKETARALSASERRQAEQAASSATGKKVEITQGTVFEQQEAAEAPSQSEDLINQYGQEKSEDSTIQKENEVEKEF